VFSTIFRVSEVVVGMAAVEVPQVGSRTVAVGARVEVLDEEILGGQTLGGVKCWRV